MQKGQFITILQIVFAFLLMAGCWSTQRRDTRALVIFIDDGRFGEISCASTLTSHPRSGVKLLCQRGAVEIEYAHDFLDLNEALSYWLTPLQHRVVPTLYFNNWSTQLFPSSPEILTRSNIEIGFESVLDTFPIHHGLWHLDATQVIQGFLQAESMSAPRVPRYQVITFSDLAFQWSKNTSTNEFELIEQREQRWESINESIYQLLTSIHFPENSNNFTIALIGIAKDKSIGSGLIFTQNKMEQNGLMKVSSLEEFSIIFHKLIKPDLLVTETVRHAETNLNPENLQLEEVTNSRFKLAIKKILQKDPLVDSIDLKSISCVRFEECEQLKIYQKLIRQLIQKNEYRRISVIKASAEGFYLNEALGNPLKLSQIQRINGLFLFKAVTDLN